MAVTQSGQRIGTLDAVRGMAVMGILLMNIVALGLPGYAYVDPTFYGLEGPADWTAWTVNHVMSDGKFRALFTMLFGASMALIAERATANDDGPGPVRTHYGRMFWLFIFGMIHAWLFWYGDILVQYAIGGTLAFLLWQWRARALWVFFAIMIALQTASSIGHYTSLAPTRTAAMAPGATPQEKAAWQAMIANEVPTKADAAAEVAGYRGGVIQAFETRAPTTQFFQTVFLPITMPEVFAFMVLGILLLRNGFLTGAWSRQSYLAVIGAGYLVAAPLTYVLGTVLRANGFDPATIALCEAGSLLLRPFIALAHAAVIILLVQLRPDAWLSTRLAAAGRMAFSNYLGTTLIATTFFYGYGFGRFAMFSRAELYIVVLAIWAAILLWSAPWLRRFQYGPLEWLWRSLSRWERQSFRR